MNIQQMQTDYVLSMKKMVQKMEFEQYPSNLNFMGLVKAIIFVIRNCVYYRLPFTDVIKMKELYIILCRANKDYVQPYISDTIFSFTNLAENGEIINVEDLIDLYPVQVYVDNVLGVINYSVEIDSYSDWDIE